LRDKLHGSRQHSECIFLADTVKRGDGLEHVSPPKTGRHLIPIEAEMQTPQAFSYLLAFSMPYF
jgi:hypothetical protein